MSVTIKAHGLLREHIEAVTIVKHAQTVGQAITPLNIPGEMGLAILVNGHLAEWNTLLHDGDIVQLVPQISGG